MRERRHDAATIKARSVDDPEPKRLWAETAARVPANPVYGFTLAPQVGLWPLGQDPQSKLEEFAVMQSGQVPERRDGRLVLEEQGAIVLVLVPGGEVLIGATSKDASSPNYDPQALDHGPDKDDERETPLLGVRLDPWFIGKYELTQAQWMRLGAENPSNFRCGAQNAAIFEKRPHKPTGLHPVENVSCDALTAFLKHVDLDLPTEAQWETACRAGVKGSWHVAEAAALDTVANLADLFARQHGARWIEIAESAALDLDDGRLDTAPIGSYAANRFGLHDMHGNVNELCRDPYQTKRRRLRPGTGEVEPEGPVEPWNAPIRGGSFRTSPGRARTAFRQPWPRASFYPINGARVGRAVRP
jgi:formylglycine-generating enzyme required for sulfatase activity